MEIWRHFRIINGAPLLRCSLGCEVTTWQWYKMRLFSIMTWRIFYQRRESGSSVKLRLYSQLFEKGYVYKSFLLLCVCTQRKQMTVSNHKGSERSQTEDLTGRRLDSEGVLTLSQTDFYFIFLTSFSSRPAKKLCAHEFHFSSVADVSNIPQQSITFSFSFSFLRQI